MGEQRRVQPHGNSWVIPVPRRVRMHLRVVHGGDLFWHVGPKGEAFVTTGAARIGGKPPGARLEKDLEAALRRCERLEHQLAARPAAVYNEGVNEGRTRHMGELIRLGVKLDTLAHQVAQLAQAVRPPRSRRRPGQGAQRLVDVIPTPILASPPSSSDGGADTSGAAPPGVPPRT